MQSSQPTQTPLQKSYILVYYHYSDTVPHYSEITGFWDFRVSIATCTTRFMTDGRVRIVLWSIQKSLLLFQTQSNGFNHNRTQRLKNSK